MKILLLINPASRSASSLREEIRSTLKAKGHEILNQDTHQKELDPNEMILKYRNDVNAVVVAGGDGSVNLVLPSLKETRLPLLVIPCGTANNLARHFSMTSDILEAVDLLNSGHKVDIDLGEVNNILFVNVAVWD